MELAELLNRISVVSISGPSNVSVREITNNSKAVLPGDIFVCIEGFQTDGHGFAKMAEEKGASCIVASRPLPEITSIPVVLVKNTRLALAELSKAIYHDPSSRLKIIGVTGTNGKTTVSYLIKSILDTAGHKTGLIGTNETIAGDTPIPAMRTTPESHELNKLFQNMIEFGMEYCVMEVSSHSLELCRVADIHFSAGVFTNLTQDHLDFHQTMENYFQAKTKLFQQSGHCIVNIDNDYGKRLAEMVSDKLTAYSVQALSDNQAVQIDLKKDGCAFSTGGTRYRMQIPGLFSVYNGLAAVSLCRWLGVPESMIQKGLSATHGAKGRAEFIPVPADFQVMIDYAHTADGLYNILSTIKNFAPGRILCVFGAAGERDAAKRPSMGETVGTYADYAIITSDNPIHECAADIISQVEIGMKRTKCPYLCIEDRKEAILTALSMAKKEDLILLAGKGHETYQLIGDEKVPFSERDIVLNYFQSNP